VKKRTLSQDEKRELRSTMTMLGFLLVILVVTLVLIAVNS